MTTTSLYRIALGAASGLALLGCGDPVAPGSDRPSLLVGTDPDPGNPGLFLGTEVTDATCPGGLPDTDRDDLADRCEVALAAAFAPELAYATSDDTRRQPRWVARPLIRGRVRLAYLTSMYLDRGTPGCSLGLVLCGGHYGDSEILVLDVYYDGPSRHWLLDQAIYSAHGVYNVYPRLFAPYPGMNYPAKAGGYPRAFLSLGKHAGYRSDRECDAGELGLDECRADTRVRIAAGANLDLGSRSVHTGGQDCVAGPTPGTARFTECYWTDRAFAGWQGRTPTANGYSRILSTFGF